MTSLHSSLRQSGQAQLTPQASERIKQRLLTEFALRPPSTEHPIEPIRRFRFERLLARPFAFSVVSLVLIILVTILSAEADAAKPGDALYTWDRGIERVRLTFTIPPDARTAFQARLKNERAAEQAALQALRKQDHGPERTTEDQPTNQPLEQAQETIAEQQDIHAAGERGNSGEALQQVEEKLAENQARQTEPKNENGAPSTAKENNTPLPVSPTLTKAEVRVRGGVATIQLRLNGVASTFTMTWTNVTNTVREISNRTGVTEKNIRRVLKVRRFGGDTNVLVTPKDRPLPLPDPKELLRGQSESSRPLTPTRP